MDQDPVPLIEDVLILPEVQEILESSSERGGISAVDAWERNARKDEEKAHENQGSDLSESTTVANSESDSSTCHLRIGEHPPELNAAMNDLRTNIPAQIASLRRILVEKERQVLQLQQIRQLEAELHHLKQVEVQLAQYEKMSVEALEKELERLQQQVTDLSRQIESAVQNELKLKQSRKFLV